MARLGSVGYIKDTFDKRRSVHVRTDMRVSRSSPADNMPKMRTAIMFNIFHDVAVPLSQRMERSARQEYPWQDQPKGTVHTAGKGYPNDNASQQIIGSATQFGDVITIALAHSMKTFQKRSGMRGGSTRPIYYGNILEVGEGGAGAGDGKYPILVPTMELFRDEFERDIANRGAKGITYAGAGTTRKPKGA